MQTMKTILGAAFLVISTALAGNADPMPAAEVKAFFAEGGFAATAGSKFTFSGNGTFAIQHSNGSEKGTYTVGADGTVTRMRDGAKKPDVFFIDLNAKGKKVIVYTSGQYKGKKFPLK